MTVPWMRPPSAGCTQVRATVSEEKVQPMKIPDFPPPYLSIADERQVGVDEIMRNCSETVARLNNRLTALQGIDLSSVVISFSERFGYVFRYTIDLTDANEATVGAKEGIKNPPSILVACTRDCHKIVAVTYPGYDLTPREIEETL